tara:strand:- start:2072 stop:2323 length:252 start_codon:yes stop_codon:yes gene_type:complete
VGVTNTWGTATSITYLSPEQLFPELELGGTILYVPTAALEILGNVWQDGFQDPVLSGLQSTGLHNPQYAGGRVVAQPTLSVGC